MKISYAFLFIFSLAINSLHSQTQSTEESSEERFQIGLTGLPLIAITNSPRIMTQTYGFALYGNFGWLLDKNHVVGARPFYAKVAFSDLQETNSAGLNIYYRLYLNQRPKTRLFIEAHTGLGALWYQSNRASIQQFVQQFNGLLFNYAFGPGINIKLKDGYHLEILTQYIVMQNASFPDNTTVEHAIIPSLGVQKFF